MIIIFSTLMKDTSVNHLWLHLWFMTVLSCFYFLSLHIVVNTYSMILQLYCVLVKACFYCISKAFLFMYFGSMPRVFVFIYLSIYLAFVFILDALILSRLPVFTLDCSFILFFLTVLSVYWPCTIDHDCDLACIKILMFIFNCLWCPFSAVDVMVYMTVKLQA